LNVWQTKGKTVAPYVWTANDYAIEHGDTSSGATSPRVTPYRIKPGALTGASQLTAGQPININLNLVPQIGEAWTITRFFPEPNDRFDWEELTGDDLVKTADCKTIGDLCQKLFLLNPLKYVDVHYNFAKMTPSAKHAFASMLFEFWGNAQFRYDVSKEGFDWSVFKEEQLGAPGVAAVQGDKRLRWVLVQKPLDVARAVAPGGTPQTISAPPDVFRPLELHVAEILTSVNRATSLFEQSAVYMQERTKLAARATALRVLLQTSASAKTVNGSVAADLAGKARTVEDAINKPMQEAKLSEVMGKTPGAPTLALQAVIRKELGFVDDIAAAVKAHRDSLSSKLFDDGTLFAQHIENWGVWVNDHKQQSSPVVVELYTKLCFAVARAMDILNETDVESKYHDKIVAILAAVPEAAFSDLRKAGPSAAHKLTAFIGNAKPGDLWSWLGNAAGVAGRAAGSVVLPNLPNIAGNLAGPPSVLVALRQSKAWREFRAQISDMSPGFELRMQNFVKDTVAELERGTPMKVKTKEAFVKAMNAHDQKALNEIRGDILDEFSGTYQASPSWKLGGLLLQLCALGVAWADYRSKVAKGEASWQDKVSFGLSASMVGIGAIDTFIAGFKLEKMAVFSTVSRALQPLGMALGLVTAMWGFIMAVRDTEVAAQKGNALGVAAGVAGIAGNTAMLIACALWFAKTPVPEISLAAMGLLGVAGVLAFIDAERERSKTVVSRVALQLVQNMQLNPFYDTLVKSDPNSGISAALTAIEQSCTEGHRPPPPNNDFVLKALRDAGFDPDTILAMVDQSGAPLIPGVPAAG
jgi:hypothetical protein